MCKNMPPLELAIQFHGHICPGLLMGVRVAEFALQHLEADSDFDEELLAVVETNSCGVDALQAILGCTFGKGNLLFKDHGKSVYTIASRTTNKAIRVAQRFAFDRGEHWIKYSELARRQDLSQAERAEKENLLGLVFERIMSMPFEDIFTWAELDFDFPTRAQIYPTVQCERCAEGVMEPRAYKTQNGYLCKPCANREGA